MTAPARAAGRTQIFEASSTYQVLVLAAALDAGLFAPADRRILLFSVNSDVPEIARPIIANPAVAPLLARFDTVASFNDLVFPLHPTAFRPRDSEVPLFERAFRLALAIPADHVVELALESIQTPPARSILAVFSESPATVYAEGLMSYGPTRDPLTPGMATRISRVLYLDLIPGITPMLLTENGVRSVPIAPHAFRAVVRELAGADAAPDRGEPYALILGQYLAALGLIEPDAEVRLYSDLIAAAAHRGVRRVVFRPHPSAPPMYGEALAARAALLGITLDIRADALPVEVLYERDPPVLVLSCFSTGLLTAGFWSIPGAAIGTAAVLAALPRTEDSNRIPLTIVDRMVPLVQPVTAGVEELAPAIPAADVDRLRQLLVTVGYCMQWRSHGRLRAAATEQLLHDIDDVRRFVPRSRLRALMLPGGTPLTLSPGAFERVAGRLEAGRRSQLRLRREAQRLRGLPVPPT